MGSPRITYLVMLAAFSFNAAFLVQEGASRVSTITDPSGAGVPTCAIKVTQHLTGFTRPTETGPDGAYSVTVLPPATYSVEASKNAFQPSTRGGMTLSVRRKRQQNSAKE